MGSFGGEGGRFLEVFLVELRHFRRSIVKTKRRMEIGCFKKNAMS